MTHGENEVRLQALDKEIFPLNLISSSYSLDFAIALIAGK